MMNDEGLSHPLVLEGYDDAENEMSRKHFDSQEDQDRYNMGYDLCLRDKAA